MASTLQLSSSSSYSGVHRSEILIHLSMSYRVEPVCSIPSSLFVIGTIFFQFSIFCLFVYHLFSEYRHRNADGGERHSPENRRYEDKWLTRSFARPSLEWWWLFRRQGRRQCRHRRHLRRQRRHRRRHHRHRRCHLAIGGAATTTTTTLFLLLCFQQHFCKIVFVSPEGVAGSWKRGGNRKKNPLEKKEVASKWIGESEGCDWEEEKEVARKRNGEIEGRG